MHNRAVQAQSNGTCVCQPSEIEFTFNFALGCANRTILAGQPGIDDAVCVVLPIDDMVDKVPISVSAITVSELDFNLDPLNPLKTKNYTDIYLSGDTFTYESFSVSDTDSVENGTIPIGLQLEITGLNADNEVITNTFVIIFTNDCTIYPVLDTDSTIGWVSLVGNHLTACINVPKHFSNYSKLLKLRRFCLLDLPRTPS